MNIGPLMLPIGAVIFFASVAAAVVAARLAARGRVDTESAVFIGILAGLVVARLSFVLRYWPGYHGNFLKMLDYRDMGFDPLPGMAAGALAILWMIVRRRNLRRPLLIATAAGVIVWGAGGVASDHWQRPAPVPTLALPGADGVLQSLAPRDGRPLVVNLWATWCGPCRAEMPVLAKAQANDRRMDLFFVNQGESPATVQAFLQELGLHLANSLFDPGLKLAKAAGVTGYPTTLFYDASGQLAYRHVGLFSEATLDATLSRLYPPTAPPGKR